MNPTTQYYARPENVRRNYCLCTCYACYHLCDQNSMVAMPMATIKHLLHEERNNLGGPKAWNGTLQHVGQNAPKKPEDFSYVSKDFLEKKALEAHKRVWDNQPNKGGGYLVTEGAEQHVEHWNCNCGCDSCRSQCAEKPHKDALAKKSREETQVNLRKNFVQDLVNARYEMDNYIGGMTPETAARVVLGAVMVLPTEQNEG